MSNPRSQAFLITGATGQQGGHTARTLLSSGHRVHALVRDPASPASQAIASLGGVLFKGDFADPSAIAIAAIGCQGVFLNVYPIFTDPDGELKHAQNIIAACHAAGVTKIVYSSATRVSDYPEMKADGRVEVGSSRDIHSSSKYRIQEAVKMAGFESWTILQPAWLMSNLLAPNVRFSFPELAERGLLKTAFEPETRLQVVDPKDVGAFAAEALTSSGGGFGPLIGQVVPLAGQEVTMGQIAEAINKCLQGKERSVKAEFMVGEEKEKMKVLNPMVDRQVWISKNGFGVDLEKVRGYGIPMGTLEEFLEREKVAMDQALTG